ncbi:MAG: cwlJ [Bacillales bacterium]|jgi:N-acetylmuramoyl-L-alanine amidase|nr:cwlJ [Bacillales bacterium]
MGAVVRYTSEEEKLLARLLRAEAEGEGTLGMLLVGNTGVNRVLSKCLDFKNINTIKRMIYQSPGGFEAVQKSYFYQKARDKDIRIARRALRGERHDPASFSLWYFRPSGRCPARWYGQWNSGRYKSHCFFIPTRSNCPKVY